MYRIKHKKSKKIYYFRFFGSTSAKEIWYTPSKESVGFNNGCIDDFIPLGKTWREIFLEEL